MRPAFALLLALVLPACGSSSAAHSQAPDAGQEAAAADAAPGGTAIQGVIQAYSLS